MTTMNDVVGIKPGLGGDSDDFPDLLEQNRSQDLPHLQDVLRKMESQVCSCITTVGLAHELRTQKGAEDVAAIVGYIFRYNHALAEEVGMQVDDPIQFRNYLFTHTGREGRLIYLRPLLEKLKETFFLSGDMEYLTSHLADVLEKQGSYDLNHIKWIEDLTRSQFDARIPWVLSVAGRETEAADGRGIEAKTIRQDAAILHLFKNTKSPYELYNFFRLYKERLCERRISSEERDIFLYLQTKEGFVEKYVSLLPMLVQQREGHPPILLPQDYNLCIARIPVRYFKRDGGISAFSALVQADCIPAEQETGDPDEAGPSSYFLELFDDCLQTASGRYALGTAIEKKMLLPQTFQKGFSGYATVLSTNRELELSDEEREKRQATTYLLRSALKNDFLSEKKGLQDAIRIPGGVEAITALVPSFVELGTPLGSGGKNFFLRTPEGIDILMEVAASHLAQGGVEILLDLFEKRYFPQSKGGWFKGVGFKDKKHTIYFKDIHKSIPKTEEGNALRHWISGKNFPS